MNAKEMQAAIEGLQQELTAMKQTVTNLEAVNNGHAETVKMLRANSVVQLEEIQALRNCDTDTQNSIMKLLEAVTELAEHRTTQSEMIEDLSAKVNGRNKSAATKRNMTEADALTVMTGDLKDLSHKDAAEKIGLTYAQVYSARGEFTFKDVHKTLREGGWINPWAKK